MAAGEHDAGLASQYVGGEVKGRGRHQADIADMATGVGQALDQALDQYRAGQAAVTADTDIGFTLGQALRTNGAADPVGGLGVQGVTEYAADIVGAENALG
ncbi:hypothetical protein D3C85_1112650 [compost metagenome]